MVLQFLIKNGDIIESNYIKLGLCKPGQKVQLSGLLNSSKDFLVYLNERNLKIGTVLNIESVESFDKSMVINYEDYIKANVSAMVCERILVEVI